jgi:hypothetical protein
MEVERETLNEIVRAWYTEWLCIQTQPGSTRFLRKEFRLIAAEFQMSFTISDPARKCPISEKGIPAYCGWVSNVIHYMFCDFCTFELLSNLHLILLTDMLYIVIVSRSQYYIQLIQLIVSYESELERLDSIHITSSTAEFFIHRFSVSPKLVFLMAR